MRYSDTTNASESRKRRVAMVSISGKRTEFDSIRDAAKETGLHEPCICRCCRGKQSITGGFRFFYIPIKPAVQTKYLNLTEAAKKCGISQDAMRYKTKELSIDRISKGGKRLYFKESDIDLAISKDLFRDRRKRRKSIIFEED